MCIRASRRHPSGHWLYDPDVRIEHLVPDGRATLGYFVSRCHDEGLAKATMVVHNVGTRDGLATEREYVLRTLPLGLLRGLLETVQHRNIWGAARSGMIVAGLAATTVGYARGRLVLTAVRMLRCAAVPR